VALTVQELAQEVRESNKRLTDTVQRLADAVHDLEGAVRKLEFHVKGIDDTLTTIKRIGWGVAVGFIGVLGSGFYIAYRAGQIESSVIALQKDSAEGKTDLKAQLDRIEKALAQNPPAHPKPAP
jgi:uncharacterized protein YlxW (UPF0749 family)